MLLPSSTASETFLHKSERCEELTGYLSLQCRPGGDWANTWHWTKRLKSSFHAGSSISPSYTGSSISPSYTGSSISPSYLYIFYVSHSSRRPLLEICTNYIIMIRINNNIIIIIILLLLLWKASRPYFVLQNSHAHAIGFLRNLWTIWAQALKKVSYPWFIDSLKMASINAETRRSGN
jgi:hypothetical protein